MVIIRELPNELEEEQVLTQLPSKKVGQFRIISKPVNDVLSSQIFIERHYERHSINPVIVIVDEYGGVEDMIYDGYSVNVMTIPDGYESYNLVGMGSVRGIICYLTNGFHKFVMWNPLLKERREFDNLEEGSCLTYGFGYNSIKKDHILVWIALDFTFKIFSFKEASWSHALLRVDISSELRNISVGGRFLDGIMYWGMARSENQCLLAYNVNDDTFDMLKPKEWRDCNYLIENVNKTSDGFLLVVCTNMEKNLTDVWMMRTNLAWVKILCYEGHLLCFLGDHKWLVHHDKHIKVFNKRDGAYSREFAYGNDDDDVDDDGRQWRQCMVYFHTESLASIRSL